MVTLWDVPRYTLKGRMFLFTQKLDMWNSQASFSKNTIKNEGDNFINFVLCMQNAMHGGNQTKNQEKNIIML